MIPKPPEHVVTITDSEGLQAFAERMRRRDWIAVDTEFLRERTYYPKLCLVQVADTEETGLIDIIAIDDTTPLANLLADPGVDKIFHSAEQDLEVLNQYFGDIPEPLFDTQMAAPLAGYDDQMGYARLISALLHIDLPKAHTRTDWSKRPLPPAALDYAADDVRYLAVAYRVLHEQLNNSDRLAWLAPDFERLADPARFEIDPQQAWRRLRNRHRLEPARQQILAELAAWREREAMAVDRPRKWVLGDDAIMDIANRAPTRPDALRGIKTLAARTATRHGDALVAAVARGLDRPAVALDTSPGRPDDHDKRLIKAGMAKLDECANATGIAASAIASRKMIAALVSGERDSRLLQGWRREAAGNEILAAIRKADAVAGTGGGDSR